jgi:hypothetical protein
MRPRSSAGTILLRTGWCRYWTRERLQLMIPDRRTITLTSPRPLNPNTTDARPTATATPIPSSALAAGTKAGIAVGITVFVLALAVLLWLYLSLRRRKRPTTDRSLPPQANPGPKELKGPGTFATELDASEGRRDRGPSPQELDTGSTHRKSWFSQPRRTHVVELHSMFSIQASVRRLNSRDTNNS